MSAFKATGVGNPIDRSVGYRVWKITNRMSLAGEFVPGAATVVWFVRWGPTGRWQPTPRQFAESFLNRDAVKRS